jgi:hypothetical protein
LNIDSADFENMVLRATISLSALAALAAAAPPTLGPWPFTNKSYKVPALDSTDPSVWMV